jgi:glycosyltransferase involved in cell wall biosynthesis
MHILIFFTYDYSLKMWQDEKILERELIYYNNILDKNKDFKFTFVTYGDENDLIFVNQLNRIKVIPAYTLINRSPNKLIRYIKSFLIPFYVNKKIQNVDIIKQFQLLGSWISIIYKFLIKKPLIIRTGYDMYKFSIQDGKSIVKQFFYRSLTYISLIFSDFYTVTSKSDKDFLNNKFKVNNSRVVIRPNWVEVVKTPSIFNRPLNKILAIGRIEKQKNFQELLLAFENSNYKIDLYGEGTLRQQLSELSEKRSINVSFKGKIQFKDLQKIYSNYCFFVSTSIFEGNPKTILEAQAAGCVVVALREKNTEEIIKNGFNGLLVENFNDILNTINSLDQETLRKISSNSINYISKTNELGLIVDTDIEDFLNLSDFSY